MRGPHRSYFCDFSFQYQYRGPHRKQTISFIVAINFFFHFVLLIVILLVIERLPNKLYKYGDDGIVSIIMTFCVPRSVRA